MSRYKKALATVGKIGVIGLLGAGAIAGGASAASAGGTGNTVNNCYGIYWNTDWDQRCGTGGASVTGWYHSTGDCTSSGDKYLSRYRNRGDAASVDGGDCRFQVINVRTTFS